MNSKIISLVKKTFSKELKNKEIIDIIIFGSSTKGKASPEDIDIAVIAEKNFDKKIEGFHISVLKPKDFVTDQPSLINTLLREGYSIRHNKRFAELYRFTSKVMFLYDLSLFKNTEKVKIVSVLRGKNKQKGFVEQNNGEWLGNGIFSVDPDISALFEKMFINFKMPYKKRYILMH